MSRGNRSRVNAEAVADANTQPEPLRRPREIVIQHYK